MAPSAAAALAAAIFLVDTFTPFGMAVAVLYVLVILIAASFCDRRQLQWVGAACGVATILAFTLSHGTAYNTSAFARCLISLAAIAITTLLVDRNKQGELSLRRSKAQLMEAQRLSKTGSFGWDPATGDIYWSDETYRILEFEPHVVPTLECIFMRTHPDDRVELQQLLHRVGEGDRSWTIQHRLLLPDGRIKHVHVVAHAERDGRNGLEYIGAVMDVTDARAAAADLAQARANLAHVNRISMLGEMTASIAHEVSQPVAAMRTHAGAGLRWLKAGNLDEVQQSLAHISADGERTSKIISRIRALAMKAPPRKEPVNVNDAIREVVGLLRGEAERSRASLRTDLDANMPSVGADRIQIQQVVLNLVVNAIEAMGNAASNQREVLITSKVNGVALEVRVHDTGPGLPADQVPKVFEAFYTTKSSGIGMGLAICRSIIEAHEGQISAAPNTPHGAVFHFTLPIVESQPDTP
jgi:signal transduction histidine kinase